MRLLLTGATGFVGRNILLREMVENRYEEVWVPVRSLEKLKEQFLGDGFSGIPAKIKPVLSSASDWKLAGAPKFEHVVHAAGTLFALSKKEYFDVNVDGTLALFRQIQTPDRALILSSQAASGPCRQGDGVKCEGESDEPVTWYGHSKLEMEKRMSAEFPQLNYLCLRPPMVIGPRDQATLPLFKMVRHHLFFKPGFKTKSYSYISVFDLVAAIFAALEDEGDWRSFPGRYYFIASNAPVTDRELISLAAKASNRKGIFVTVPQGLLWVVSQFLNTIPRWRASLPSLSPDRAKEIWPNRWVVSSKAFQERFRWMPREDLAQTINKTREWYVKTGQLA